MDEQRLRPRLAAIHGSIDAAHMTRPERMTHGRDVRDVRVRRMHPDRADLLTVHQADLLPGLAAIGRAIDPRAVREILAEPRFARPGPDDVRITRRNGTRKSVMFRHVCPPVVVFQTPPSAAPK
jgi:hypothetical protein